MSGSSVAIILELCDLPGLGDSALSRLRVYQLLTLEFYTVGFPPSATPQNSVSPRTIVHSRFISENLRMGENCKPQIKNGQLSPSVSWVPSASVMHHQAASQGGIVVIKNLGSQSVLWVHLFCALLPQGIFQGSVPAAGLMFLRVSSNSFKGRVRSGPKGRSGLLPGEPFTFFLILLLCFPFPPKGKIWR